MTNNIKALYANHRWPGTSWAVFFLLALWIGLSAGTPAAAQTTPNFGPNVYIVTPTMTAAQISTILTNACPNQCTFTSGNGASESNYIAGQFSSQRTAVLFMPGSYSGINSQVGFYESVAGLGLNPSGVQIGGSLFSSQTDTNGNVTTNFWRSMENMEISTGGSTLYWAVSQGADVRRLLINGPVQLTNSSCGEASGGFISDVVITGSMSYCSQQQWYTRNSSISSCCVSVRPTHLFWESGV